VEWARQQPARNGDDLMRTRRSHGFTVLEIVVVMAIVAVLAGLLMPALLQSRERGRQTRCINNLHQIYQALHLYATNWDGTFPAHYLADAVTPSRASGSILICASDDFDSNPLDDMWADNPSKRTSYVWARSMNTDDTLAFMEANHPSAGLVACAHHGYLQNRIYNRSAKVLRLAFDGSVKSVTITPIITPPNTVVQFSLAECLGWERN
jgi:prepilin-type N-terminal cleavage/methylation domain-containing protein